MSNKETRFSWKARVKSFQFAGKGIWRFFRTEHNAWIHLGATVIVIACSVFLKITLNEAIVVTFCIAFVWVTEMINTAIEKAMDYITSERKDQIRDIKDMAAGAVLIAAITSIIAGSIIFIPRFISLL
ncbi:MAG TPA: diacylglycerol kinase family protein [Flavisolibacter sp.]|nr:diacylglycerol kinase family protein [Flavisolibacter sp.]